MENEMLLKLGINLAELAVKGTVGKVSAKIAAVKEEKNLEIVKNKYDEIVNEILSEREEAIRIAHTYKNEIDKIMISDSDIEHLHHTVDKVLNIIKELSPEKDISSFETFKEIINVDTLKSMQLLGFNYKKAIGEPLTELCAEKIKEVGRRKTSKR